MPHVTQASGSVTIPRWEDLSNLETLNKWATSIVDAAKKNYSGSSHECIKVDVHLESVVSKHDCLEAICNHIRSNMQDFYSEEYPVFSAYASGSRTHLPGIVIVFTTDAPT